MEADRVGGGGLLGRLGWGHRGFRADTRGATIGLLAILLLPFISDQFAFQTRMRDWNPDFKGWLANAETLLADPGQPFYPKYPFYIYPPFFLTLIWPLTKLPVPAAAFVFETIKWVALFFSLRLAWRLCAPREEDVPPIVALGSLLLSWRFIDNDLAQGNVNLLLLWLTLAGCWLCARGWQIAAGALISVAVCVKVAPVLILVYFLYKGWWRPLVGAAAGVLVCFVVWPALWFGWAENLRLLGEWYQAVVAGFLERGAVRSEHGNQALVGVLNRLFGPHVGILSGKGENVQLTIVNLPQWARDMIRLSLTGGVLGGLAWICRRRLSPARQQLALAAELSLVLIAMLLLSGLSWKAHFVTMILPYSVLLAFLADARYPGRRRRAIGVLLGVSFALCTLTADFITPRGADYAEGYGLVALGAVTAGAGVWLVCVELRRADGAMVLNARR